MAPSNVFISGPQDWYQFEFKSDSGDNKTIHLFSDIHDFTNLCPRTLNCVRHDSALKKDTKCVEFDYFLELIFRKFVKEKRYLDFFLESPFRLEQRDLDVKKDTNYIDIINNRFRNCLIVSKQCIFSPFVRMHYTDVRNPDYKYITIGSFVYEFYKFMIECMLEYYQNKITFSSLVYVVSVFNILLDIVSRKSKDISYILLTENNFEKKILSIFDPLTSFVKAAYDRQSGPLERTATRQRSDVGEKVTRKIDEMFSQLFSLVKKRGNDRIFIVKHQIDELRKENLRYNNKNVADIVLSFFIEFSDILSEKAMKENYRFWYENKYTEKILNSNNMFDTAKELFEKKQEVINNNILFDLTYLDAYILARIFRKFNSKESDTVIVYAGSLHIESQRQFFETFMSIRPEHFENTKDRCLSSKYLFDQRASDQRAI